MLNELAEPSLLATMIVVISVWRIPAGGEYMLTVLVSAGLLFGAYWFRVNKSEA